MHADRHSLAESQQFGLDVAHYYFGRLSYVSLVLRDDQVVRDCRGW